MKGEQNSKEVRDDAGESRQWQLEKEVDADDEANRRGAGDS